MNPGEESGVPIIKEAMKKGLSYNDTVIIDCPPGSACSVMESVSFADYCVLVVEPTVFGLHNFKMVYELTSLLKKPCCVVINKANKSYTPLENFCEEHKIPIMLSISYSDEFATWGANAQIAAENSEGIRNMFRSLIDMIKEEVQG